MDHRIDRRSLLRLAGVGALGLAVPSFLTACGGGPSGGGVSNAGKDLAPWPTYVPFTGPTPDAPGDDSGVQPLYLKYPERLVRSVGDTPGDGSDVTVMVLSYGAPPKPVGDNQYWQAVNRALGVNLKVIVVPDPEYGQKMATLMASSGDLPDLVMFSNLALPHAAEFVQARCADLSEFVGGDAVKEYPNLANLPTYAWKGMGRIGGKLHGVPLERPMPANSLFVNRTALDAAGIPLDWTTEQHLDAMKQLTGDRKWGVGWFKTLFGGLGGITYHAGSLGAPNTWSADGGAFAPTLATPQFEQALEVMRELVESGAHYPDSLTTSSTDMQSHFHNGTVATMNDGFGSVSLATMKKIDGRFALDLGRPYGPQATPWQGPGVFGHVTFKKAEPARVKLLLRIVDYLSAPFGTEEHELANYGVEGKHFTKDADGIRTTDLYGQENNSLLPTKYVGAAPAVLYLPGYPDAAKAVHEWQKATLPRSVRNPATGLRSATEAGKGAQLGQIVGEGIAAVAFGRKPLSAWKDVVTQWRQAGGDRVAGELAEEHAANR
ncbi:extracellular solute-binding protein [Saccharothrix texasensis]|uniref:Carbohydrate ABC transporter substrate-binding protein (CUT1 family) n=1 Tax=Saccharothrix texasensis TaxID=103734 RepID=A0A3N1H1F0_9PSEU|nr:extracellular solute-binding protein [Saccharothrix texasensis]ROP36092.1 carbohydrate ABC transporter substrate-binding protein (CUT1 family) [Saccharothrix texasensis]